MVRVRLQAARSGLLSERVVDALMDPKAREALELARFIDSVAERLRTSAVEQPSGRRVDSPPTTGREARCVGAIEHSVRNPSVADAIAPFVARVMSAHPGWTADELYRHMRRTAGEDGSPFARLESGADLFCIDAGRPCGSKSVAAALTRYRAKQRGVKRS